MKNVRFKKFIATLLIVAITVTSLNTTAYASIFIDMLKYLSGLSLNLPNYYYLDTKETTTAVNETIEETTESVEANLDNNVGENLTKSHSREQARSEENEEENSVSPEDDLTFKDDSDEEYSDEPEVDEINIGDEDEAGDSASSHITNNDKEEKEENINFENNEATDEEEHGSGELASPHSESDSDENIDNEKLETIKNNEEETDLYDIATNSNINDSDIEDIDLIDKESNSNTLIESEMDFATDSDLHNDESASPSEIELVTDSDINNGEVASPSDLEELSSGEFASPSEIELATDSEIANSEFATDSELGNGELATNSELGSGELASPSIYIATVSKATWKIEKILISTYSDTDSYVIETVEDRLSRLSKKASVKLVNEFGETKIITVPIKWLVKDKFSVDGQNENDLDKVRDTLGIKKIVEEENNVNIISTSNEIYLKEKIKETLDESEENYVEVSLRARSEDNDVSEIFVSPDETPVSTINEITSYNNTEIDNSTISELEPTDKQDNDEEINEVLDESSELNEISTSSDLDSALTEKIELDDMMKQFMYIDSIELMQIDMDDLTNKILLALTYGDDYFKDELANIDAELAALHEEHSVQDEDITDNIASESEIDEKVEDNEEKSIFSFFKNIFAPKSNTSTKSNVTENEKTNDDEVLDNSELTNEQNLIKSNVTEDILITLVDSQIEGAIVENIIYSVIPGLTHGPRWDSTGTKQIGWVAHRICGENSCSHEVEITLTHTFAEYKPLEDSMTLRDYVGTFSNAAYFLTKDTVLRGKWIIESDKEQEIGLSICTNGYNLTFGTSSVIRGAVQGRSYNNLGRFNICNCQQKDSKINTEVDYNYIDRYGNPDEKIRFTYIVKDSSTGNISVQMKEAGKGQGITRYRDVPLANCGKIGVYGGLKFSDIFIENYYNNSTSLYLMEEQVPDNPTDTNGTGSLFNAQEIEIFDAEFKDIYCIRTNGAIANSYPGPLTVQDVNIKNCFVDGNGGAFVANSDRIKLYNINFDNVNATVNGGCVYGALPLRTATQAELKSYFKYCKFNNSQAGNNGGAVAFNRGGNISFSSCDFISNTSEFNGGAFYYKSQHMSYYTGGELTFDSCTFDNNMARTRSGGALYIEEMGEPCKTRVSLVLSDLVNNRAQGMRVPIYDRKGLDYKEWMKIPKKERDEKYWDKTTYAYLGGYGGAIYGKGHVNIYVGETFETNIKNNIANQGGAICVNNSGMSETSYNQIELMNSFLSNNKSLNVDKNGESISQLTGYMYTTDGGGALYIMGGAKVRVNASCELSNNLNAIYMNGGYLDLEAGSINKNYGTYFIGTCKAASNSIIFKDVELTDHSFKGYKWDITKENKEYNITTYSFIGNVKIRDNVETDMATSKTFASDLSFEPEVNKFDFSKNSFVSDNDVGILIATDTLLHKNWDKENVKGFNNGMVFSSLFYIDNGDLKEHKGSDGSKNMWRFYRDNSKIYAGIQYDAIHFDFGLPNAPKNPKDQYIAKNTAGSLIDLPYEVTVPELHDIPGHTFIGFIGHDVSATTSEYFGGNTPLFSNWYFDSSLIKVENNINNTLYGVYALDTALMKACGTPNGQACDHDNGVNHIDRGVAADGKFEDKLYKSYIAVGTAAQLYYKYWTHPTQYALDRDVHIPNDLEEINDQMVLNLNGYTLYVDKAVSSVFNINKDRPHTVRVRGTTSEVPTLYERSGANTFITGKVISEDEKDLRDNGIVSYEGLVSENSTFKPFANMNHYDAFFGSLDFTDLTLDDARADKAIVYSSKTTSTTKNEIEFDEVNFNNIDANINLVTNDKITLRDVVVEDNTLKNVLFNIHEASNSILKVYGDNSEIRNNTLYSEIVKPIDGTTITIGNLDVHDNDFDASASTKLFTFFNVRRGSKFIVDKGKFKITDNKFTNTTVTTTKKYAGINATEVIYFGDGAMVATRNTIERSIVEPYQYCINVSITDPSKYDVRKYIFSQIAGTKFIASESYITIGADIAIDTYKDYDLLVYEGWNPTKVKDQGELQSTLFTNTFIKDMYHYRLLEEEARQEFDLYKKGKDDDTSIRLGISRVKTKYILHYDYDDPGIEIYSQSVAKGEESQIERPIIEGHTVDTIDGEVVFRRIFWEGPDHDYEVEGTRGYHENIVYERELLNVTTIMKNDFEVHGYFSGVHNHATMSEYHNDSVKDYWVEARTEKDLQAAEANIFLSRDITITKRLVPLITGNYSICLNGHKLIFTNGVDWLDELNNENINIHIVDCTMHGEVTLKDISAPINNTLFNVEKGSFYLSSVSIAGVTSFVPYLNLGVEASLDMRHVGFNGNTIGTTEEQGFINMFGPAYIEDVTISSNNINMKSSFIYHKSANNDVEIKDIHIDNNKISDANTVGAVIKIDSLGTLTMSSGSIINNNFPDRAVIKTSAMNVKLVDFYDISGNSVYELLHIDNDDTSDAYRTVELNNLNITKNNIYGTLYGQDVVFSSTETKDTYGISMKKLNIINNDYFEGNAVEVADYKQTNDRGVYLEDIIIKDNKKINYTPLYIDKINNVITAKNITIENNTRLNYNPSFTEANANAVFINEVADANITNLKVNNNTYANTADSDKGSVYITNYDTTSTPKTNVYIDGLTFTNNKNKNAGALNIGNNVEVIATGSIVMTGNSTVDPNGSAITMNNDDSTLKLIGDTLITQNKVKDNGAVFYEKGTLVLGGKLIIDKNILDDKDYGYMENIVLEQRKAIVGDPSNPIRKDSIITVTARDYNDNTQIFNYWNENTIEEWGTAVCYTPDQIFKLDDRLIEINKSAREPFRVYKSGTGNNVSVVIGKDCKELNFYDEDDNLVATQYLSNGILTTIDKVFIANNPKLPLEAQIWSAPGEEPTSPRTYWDMVNHNYNVKLINNDFAKIDADRPIIIFNPNAPISPLDKPGATISEYNKINKDTVVQWVNFAEAIPVKDTGYEIPGFTLLGYCKEGEEPSIDDVDDPGYTVPIPFNATLPKEEYFPGDTKRVYLSAVWKRNVYTYTININDKTHNNNGSTDADPIIGPGHGSSFTIKYDTDITGEYLPSRIVNARPGYQGLMGFSKESHILAKDMDSMYFANVGGIMREAATESNITIYAIWKPKKYDITVDLRGGKYEEKVTFMNFTQYFDEPFNIDNGDKESPKGKDGTLLTPVKDKSEFHFYTLDETIKPADVGTLEKHNAVLNTKGILATTSLTCDLVDPDGMDTDLTLYALYTGTEYKVTFKGNGGEVFYKKDGKDTHSKDYTMTIKYSYIDGGEDFVMPAGLRTGYKQGTRATEGRERLWLVGTTSIAAREATKDNLFFLEDDSDIVYANWYPIQYKVKLSLGAAEPYRRDIEGELPDFGSTIDCVYDEEVNLPSIDITWGGRKVKHWVLTPVPYDIYGNQLYKTNLVDVKTESKPDVKVKNLSTTEGTTVNLILLWTDYYVIQFDKNDGTPIDSNYNLYANRNDPVTLPNNIVFMPHATDPDNTYDSYTTNANGTGTTYKCEQEVTRITTGDMITLYIKWKKYTPGPTPPGPGPGPGPGPSPGPSPSPGGGSNTGGGGGGGGGRIARGDAFIANTVTVQNANGENVIWNIDANGNTKVTKQNGEAVKGWIYINNDNSGGGYYYFDKDTGYMVKGWVEDGGKHYYLSEADGKLFVGDVYNGGVLYSFDREGALLSAYEMTEAEAIFIMAQHNTLKSTGTWEYDPSNDKWKFYRLGETKDYVTNDWIYETNDHGKTLWYALDKNGNMLTGFICYQGKYYYLSEDENTRGQLQTGMVSVNGVTYNFDDSGIYADELSKIPTSGITLLGDDPINILSGLSGRWLYDAGSDKFMFMQIAVNTEGLVYEKKLQGWSKIDGKVYYFDKQGNMLTGLVESQGKYYYLSTDQNNIGVLQTGEVSVNGVKLYFDPQSGELIH